MPKKNVLTAEQRRQMVSDYEAGIPTIDIREKYGIKQSTINYWVNKLGAKKRTANYSNTAMSIIPGKKRQKCLKCLKWFQPYIFGHSSYHYICFRCLMANSECEYQPVGIGRKN